MNTKHHYILGVREDASKDEIRDAYRNLSKKFHPDLNPNDKFSEQRFKEINESYEILMSDDFRRKKRDDIRYYSNPNSNSKNLLTQFFNSKILKLAIENWLITIAITLFLYHATPLIIQLIKYETMNDSSIVDKTIQTIESKPQYPIYTESNEPVNSEIEAILVKEQVLKSENRLRTGESPFKKYFGNGDYDQNSNNSISIINGDKTDAVVFIQSVEFPFKIIRNEYVRSGENFKMTKVPYGVYKLKTMKGFNWDYQISVFSDSILGGFKRNISFSVSEKKKDLINIVYDHEKYAEIEITLHPVVGGTMESKRISNVEFFK